MRLRLFIRGGSAALGMSLFLAGCGAAPAVPHHGGSPSHPAAASAPKTVVVPASAPLPAATRAALQKSVPTLNQELQQFDAELSQLQKLLGG
ncbi:MAG: hypothetical protein K6V97_13045 [Actinomycetia bacterium]|nr:hypothetical protein [Actinomycetes bacterium]